MSGELDAAGTAIEGALLGAAVEPAHGAARQDGQDACLNCGAVLNGPFCASCGQKAQVHRTLSAIWHDILHSVLHFDGKLWRTLPMLLFKPGELTRRYVHGERAKFVSPMALFLFSVFLMFAVFSFGGASTTVDNSWMKVSAEKVDKQIAEAEKRLAGPPPLAGAERQKVEAKLKELKSDRNGLAYATTGAPVYDDVGARIATGETGMLSYNTKADTGWLWFDNLLNKGAVKMVSNPSLAFYKLQSNGYKFAWLLIPLSLPFVWLVTLGVRGHRFYDHAVFTTYSIAFMSLLFIATTLLGRLGIGDGLLGALFLLIPPVHVYKQMRHSYGLSRGSALVRTTFLLICIVIILTLFALTLLFLGFLG